MDPSMAQILSDHQAWVLQVRTAIDNDQSIPIPAYSPPMTMMERDLWQTHVRQVIHHDIPPTPAQWLAARAKVRSVASIQQAWNDLAAARVAARVAQAQAQDDGAE
jgi:hypothetical protein